MSNKQPKHWKEQYEDAATDERKRLFNTDVNKLIQDVQKGKFDAYHQIWYAIADNATLEEAGWTLYNVLISNIDYLYRYHAATGLLQLLEKAGQPLALEPVELSGNRPTQAANLAQIREILLQKFGGPPDLPVYSLPSKPVMAAKPAKKKWYEKIFGKK